MLLLYRMIPISVELILFWFWFGWQWRCLGGRCHVNPLSIQSMIIIYINKFPQSAKIRCHVDVINLFTCSIAVCECVARTSTCIYVIMLSSMARCSDSNRHSSSYSDLNRSQNWSISINCLSDVYFFFIWLGDAGGVGAAADALEHQQTGAKEEPASRLRCAQLVR